MKRRSLLVAASAIALASGCEQVLPTAPSELTTGIVVYEDANYLGQSAHVTKDIRDLKDVDAGPCVRSDTDANGTSTTYREWNDCISSVPVAAGWRATVYRDPDFKGQALEITSDSLKSPAGSGVM